MEGKLLEFCPASLISQETYVMHFLPSLKQLPVSLNNVCDILLSKYAKDEELQNTSYPLIQVEMTCFWE